MNHLSLVVFRGSSRIACMATDTATWIRTRTVSDWDNPQNVARFKRFASKRAKWITKRAEAEQRQSHKQQQKFVVDTVQSQTWTLRAKFHLANMNPLLQHFVRAIAIREFLIAVNTEQPSLLEHPQQ